jgi:hypothetical protein
MDSGGDVAAEADVVIDQRYEAAQAFLLERGADQMRHFNGTLLTHLKGTCKLLAQWGNPEAVCLAGLCHTAYGTDGFRHTFFDARNRSPLRDLVGGEAEAIVYFYASCDRRSVYPAIARIGASPIVSFRDRFDGRTFEPGEDEMRTFLELTFANELELAAHGRATIDRAGLRRVFGRCRPHVSPQAFATFQRLCS